MRHAFVQFNFHGVELSYECQYRAEPTGELYDIEAKLVMVGPYQDPPTPEQELLYVHWGQVWNQLYAALEEADARNYGRDKDDAMATDTRI